MKNFLSAFHKMRRDMKLWPATLLSIAVVAVCIMSYYYFDLPVARSCAATGDCVKGIFEWITRLGLPTPYLAATFAAFIFFKFIKKNTRLANAAAFLFMAIALSGMANDIIKILVGRSRPLLLFKENIYSFKPFTNAYLYTSFPSGHSSIIAALCCGIYLLTGRFRYILPLLVLAVMASRVVIGSHFPADVIFGAYLGVMVTALVKIGFDMKGLLTAHPEQAGAVISGEGQWTSTMSPP